MPSIQHSSQNIDTLEFNNRRETNKIAKSKLFDNFIGVSTILFLVIEIWRLVFEKDYDMLYFYLLVFGLLIIFLIFFTIKNKQKEQKKITQIKITQNTLIIVFKNQPQLEFDFEAIKTKLEQKKDYITLALETADNQMFNFSNETLDWSGKDLITIHQTLNSDTDEPKRELVFDENLIQSSWTFGFPFQNLFPFFVLVIVLGVGISVVGYNYILGFLAYLVLLFGYTFIGDGYRLITIQEDEIKTTFPMQPWRDKRYKLGALKSINWSYSSDHINFLTFETQDDSRLYRTLLTVEEVRNILYSLENRGVRTNY